MNVNHGTLPYETVETCVKVSRNCEESVESVQKCEILWDDFMKPMV